MSRRNQGKTTSFVIDPEVRKALRIWCWENDATMSRIVNRALRQFLGMELAKTRELPFRHDGKGPEAQPEPAGLAPRGAAKRPEEKLSIQDEIARLMQIIGKPPAKVIVEEGGQKS
jgi:hypothetical protein